jgi:hypothetical protein
MKKSVLLNTIAWGVVPIIFATYVNFSYSLALAQNRLPFLAPREWRWWVGFCIALLVGTGCFISARQTKSKLTIVAIGGYVLIMAVALSGIHVAVACGRGDCL